MLVNLHIRYIDIVYCDTHIWFLCASHFSSWDPIQWSGRRGGGSWSVSMDGFMDEGVGAWWTG